MEIATQPVFACGHQGGYNGVIGVVIKVKFYTVLKYCSYVGITGSHSVHLSTYLPPVFVLSCHPDANGKITSLPLKNDKVFAPFFNGPAVAVSLYHIICLVLCLYLVTLVVIF